MKQLQFLSLTLLFSLTTLTVAAQGGTSARNSSLNGMYAENATRVKTDKAEGDKAVFLNNDVIVYNETAKEKAKTTVAKTEVPKKKGKKNVEVVEKPEADYSPEVTENYLARQIVNNALEFQGTPYRGGGTTTAGMDCSGMVYATFQIFDITLPRSSSSMAVGAGHEIKLEDAKPGDLLFFDNNRRHRGVNHVGLVTEVTPEGEVKFIHSSSSRGVIVSSMSEAYHSRTFVQINRVFE